MLTLAKPVQGIKQWQLQLQRLLVTQFEQVEPMQDGLQPGGLRTYFGPRIDVCFTNDQSELMYRRVGDLILLDDRIKGDFAAVPGQLGSRYDKRNAVPRSCRFKSTLCRNVFKLCILVDEAQNEPSTRCTINTYALSRYPLPLLFLS